MISPSEILGIASDSTLEQIEAAFQEKSEYWRRLQSNSQRSTEAAAMLEQVIAAYDFLRAQAQSTASGLEYREPRSFSGQTGSTPMDKDSCAHCGHKGNPPDARYCLSCGEKLFQVCPNPSCQAELPWHYERCHHCGANVEDVQQEQERQKRFKEIELFRERERKLKAINQRFQLLSNVQSKLRSVRPLVGLIGIRGAEGQWIKEQGSAGCGTQLAWVVLFGISLVISGNVAIKATTIGLLIAIFFTLLTLSIAVINAILFFAIDRRRLLDAVAEERTHLNRKKCELEQTPDK